MLSHFVNLKRKVVMLIGLMAVVVILVYCVITELTEVPLFSAWLVLPLFLIPIFGNLIFNKIESEAMLTIVNMVHLYENECKPQSFIDAIDPILDTFKPQFDINEVWLLSAYARALVEVGKENEAKVFLEAFENHVETSDHPEEKGPMMVNYEPLLLMLEGEKAALDLLDKAEKSIMDIPLIRKRKNKINKLTAPELREDLLRSPDMQVRLRYIQTERTFLIACIDNDTSVLERERVAICSDQGSSAVLCARYTYALARSYHALNDRKNTRRMCQETIRIAKGLKCAEEAKKMLLEQQ